MGLKETMELVPTNKELSLIEGLKENSQPLYFNGRMDLIRLQRALSEDLINKVVSIQEWRQLVGQVNSIITKSSLFPVIHFANNEVLDQTLLESSVDPIEPYK